MDKTTIDFRGERVDVEYYDHGYESDTNSHVIDWVFTDKQFANVDLTDAEEQNVYDQLVEISSQRGEE